MRLYNLSIPLFRLATFCSNRSDSWATHQGDCAPCLSVEVSVSPTIECEQQSKQAKFLLLVTKYAGRRFAAAGTERTQMNNDELPQTTKSKVDPRTFSFFFRAS